MAEIDKKWIESVGVTDPVMMKEECKHESISIDPNWDVICTICKENLGGKSPAESDVKVVMGDVDVEKVNNRSLCGERV